MKIIALTSVAVVLVGCVSVRPVALPNGHQGYAINCPGTARDIGDCMNEAAKVCAGPYQIFDSQSESNVGSATRVGNSAIFVQGRKRTMIVSCGNG